MLVCIQPFVVPVEYSVMAHSSWTLCGILSTNGFYKWLMSEFCIVVCSTGLFSQSKANYLDDHPVPFPICFPVHLALCFIWHRNRFQMCCNTVYSCHVVKLWVLCEEIEHQYQSDGEFSRKQQQMFQFMDKNIPSCVTRKIESVCLLSELLIGCTHIPIIV